MYSYSGYEITFGSAGSWSFRNDFARNAVIFGVDISSSHFDNRKNNLLILCEAPTCNINGSFLDHQKKV